VDAYFWESNLSFCKQFDLDQDYFRPTQNISKKEIFDTIYSEHHNRTLNTSPMINQYRLLSARMIELCINLSKTNNAHNLLSQSGLVPDINHYPPGADLP
jgi:hypothetical protein